MAGFNPLRRDYVQDCIRSDPPRELVLFQELFSTEPIAEDRVEQSGFLDVSRRRRGRRLLLPRHPLRPIQGWSSPGAHNRQKIRRIRRHFRDLFGVLHLRPGDDSPAISGAGRGGIHRPPRALAVFLLSRAAERAGASLHPPGLVLRGHHPFRQPPLVSRRRRHEDLRALPLQRRRVDLDLAAREDPPLLLPLLPHVPPFRPGEGDVLSGVLQLAGGAVHAGSDERLLVPQDRPRPAKGALREDSRAMILRTCVCVGPACLSLTVPMWSTSPAPPIKCGETATWNPTWCRIEEVSGRSLPFYLG